MVADLEELENLGARPKSGENVYIPGRRWESRIIWRRSGSENIHLRSSLNEAKFEKIFVENQTGLNHSIHSRRSLGVTSSKRKETSRRIQMVRESDTTLSSIASRSPSLERSPH